MHNKLKVIVFTHVWMHVCLSHVWCFRTVSRRSIEVKFQCITTFPTIWHVLWRSIDLPPYFTQKDPSPTFLDAHWCKMVRDRVSLSINSIYHTIDWHHPNSPYPELPSLPSKICVTKLCCRLRWNALSDRCTMMPATICHVNQLKTMWLRRL